MKILAVIIIIFAPSKKDDQVVKGSITVSPDTFSSSVTDQVLKKSSSFSSFLYFLLTLLLPLLKKRAASLLLLWFFSCNSLPDSVTWQQRWRSWSTRLLEGKWNCTSNIWRLNSSVDFSPSVIFFRLPCSFQSENLHLILQILREIGKIENLGRTDYAVHHQGKAVVPNRFLAQKISKKWLLSICW